MAGDLPADHGARPPSPGPRTPRRAQDDGGRAPDPAGGGGGHAPPRHDDGADRPAAKALVSEDAAPLLSALKAKRRALAEAQGVPAYVIFTDRTLIEMAETRPHTLDEFARIGGVGAAKLERYGAAFLAVISGEAAAPAHPARRKLAGGRRGTSTTAFSPRRPGSRGERTGPASR
jgi:hypothetical protein